MLKCFKFSMYAVLIMALISIGASAVSSGFGGSNNDLILSTSNGYNLGENGALSDSSILTFSDALQLSKQLKFDIGPGGSLDEVYTATDPTESFGAMTYAHLDSGAGSYTGDAYFRKNQVVAYETILVNEGTNADFGGEAWSSNGDYASVWLASSVDGSTLTANKYSNKMIAKADYVSATQDLKRASGSFDVGCIGSVIQFQTTNGDEIITLDDSRFAALDESITTVETTASFENVRDLTYSGKSTYGKGSGSSQQTIKASSADYLDTTERAYNDDLDIASGSSVNVGTGLKVSDSAKFKGSDISSSVKLTFTSAEYAESAGMLNSEDVDMYSGSSVGINDEEVMQALSSSEGKELAGGVTPSSGSMSYVVSSSAKKGKTIVDKLSLKGPEIHRMALVDGEFGYILALNDVSGDDLSIKRSLAGGSTITAKEDSLSLKGSWKAQASRGAGEAAHRFIEADNNEEYASCEALRPGTLSFKESAVVTSDSAEAT